MTGLVRSRKRRAGLSTTEEARMLRAAVAYFHGSEQGYLVRTLAGFRRGGVPRPYTQQPEAKPATKTRPWRAAERLMAWVPRGGGSRDRYPDRAGCEFHRRCQLRRISQRTARVGLARLRGVADRIEGRAVDSETVSVMRTPPQRTIGAD